MKLNRPQRIILQLIVCATIGLCITFCVGCRDYDELSDSNNPIPTTNLSLGELRRLVADKSITINQDIVVGGYVTSNDREENFYRTFCFEDQTAGAEIMAGLYDLHNIFPEGFYVTASLQGCSIALHNGILQIGRQAQPYSAYPTDYFASRSTLDKHIRCHDSYQPISPKPQTISSLNEDMCGQLIVINELLLRSEQYPENWLINHEGKWQGYNIFSNSEGDIIATFTSDYASFAQHAIPKGTLSLTGILQYGQIANIQCYIIKMRDENDCKISH